MTKLPGDGVCVMVSLTREQADYLIWTQTRLREIGKPDATLADAVRAVLDSDIEQAHGFGRDTAVASVDHKPLFCTDDKKAAELMSRPWAGPNAGGGK